MRLSKWWLVGLTLVQLGYIVRNENRLWDYAHVRLDAILAYHVGPNANSADYRGEHK